MVRPGHEESSRSLKVAQLAEQVADVLRQQIQAGQGGKAVSAPVEQLQRILREVEAMQVAGSPTKFRPTYQRLIANSWDLHDDLGERLLELAHRYNKLS